MKGFIHSEIVDLHITHIQELTQSSQRSTEGHRGHAFNPVISVSSPDFLCVIKTYLLLSVPACEAGPEPPGCIGFHICIDGLGMGRCTVEPVGSFGVGILPCDCPVAIP